MAAARVSYVTYIHSAPDDVWRGLVEPELTRLYWMHEMESDWTPGSAWRQVRSDGSGAVSVAGEVVTHDRPKKLELTWARPDSDDELSTVCFELAAVEGWPYGPWTAVTLEHTGLVEGSEMHQSVSFGWPAVIAGLKSVLEAPEIFE